MYQGDSLHIADMGLQTERDMLSAPVEPVAHHGFSVWRITQRMQGCTPQQIDSVIQAHLPQRERFLSNRPDTLSIPGLPGHQAYTVDGLSKVYEETFFKDNALLHPELQVSSLGRSAIPLPYTLRRDDWVTSLLLVCFVILVYVVNRTRRQLLQQAKDFFFSPLTHQSLFAVETAVETHASLFMVFQLSLMGGLLSFAYAQYTLDLFLGQVSPYQLLVLYVVCFLVYFATKRLLAGFVNWVFFEKKQQKQWSECYGFLITAESILFFPLALIFVYFSISFLHTILIFGILLIIFKILLMYKCYTIFFQKFYCLFHLFAYLCALELMPMMALFKSLLIVTDSLIIKF